MVSASSASCRFPLLPEEFCGRALVWSQGLGSSGQEQLCQPLEKGQSSQAGGATRDSQELCHPVTLPSLQGVPLHKVRLPDISRVAFPGRHAVLLWCQGKALFTFLPGTMGSDHGVPVPVGVPGHAGTWQSLLMALAFPQGSVLFPGWLLSLPPCPAALPWHPPLSRLGFRQI